ncbi:hypothetical protein L227DRAFT_505891 [Lentinus tigrinus ALCF2SS1-6]|uniref:Uncharacterized protein n=2 Tax=Lentinus tigrinus TaxID=5365 RepID=A0A5C2S2U3_9APHY|nr:hypothetical protein L227DRAFT_505891 [Lentinus tigrinus ALCF2SS1-6]
MLPKALKFAVIRMDPVSMISHLDLDSIAIAEATAMEPKKYLIYLDTPQDLPLPESEWCRYWVQPVATVLRPAVPEQGITSDMVMPIHPNTRYAKGRQPVQSTPQFPFPNCYFWMMSRMSLRVKIKRGADVYDNDKGATISISQHVRLMSAWRDDFFRMSSLRRAAALGSGPAAKGPPQAAGPPAPYHATRHSPSSSTPTSPPTLREYVDDSRSSDDDEDSISDQSSLSSDQSDSPTSDDDGTAPILPSVPPLLEKIIDMDLFGWAHDPKVPFIPLVDLWLELEDHLSPDNIPNPAELWKEQEMIGA